MRFKVDVMKKWFFGIIVIISLLSGCRRGESRKEYESQIIDKITHSISTKDSSEVLGLISAKLKNTPDYEDSIHSMLQFVPGKIVNIKDKGSDVLHTTIEDKKSADGYSGIYIYHIVCVIVNDSGESFHLTIEYEKENSVAPDEEGINYICILSYDENNQKKEMKSIGISSYER